MIIDNKFIFTNKDSLKSVSNSPDALAEYLQYKALNHKSYKVYTTIDRLSYCEEEHSLFLSKGTRWNDTIDREAFNNDSLEVVNFGLCMSFSMSENVAMWMLYGGTKYNGVMLNYRPTHIKKIYNETKEVQYGYWDNNKFVSLGSLKSDEFVIRLSDMLYYSVSTNDENCYDIKRSNEAHKLKNKSSVDELAVVKKHYPWCYENECRLIVSVPKIIFQKYKMEITAIKIDVGDLYTELFKDKRAYIAPNFRGDSTYSKSSLYGTIDWDLCKDCQKDN